MSAPVPLPARSGVVGGGRMGAGIAHALLLAGSEVVLVEADASAAPAARQRVVDAVRRSAERGALDGAVDDVVARLEVATAADALTGCGLVVEAVPEDVELKARVFTAVEAAVGDDAVIASNTSSLPITRLAGALRRPDRALGLHFFNPVPASLLVEVVVGRPPTRRWSSGPPAGWPRSERRRSSSATPRASPAAGWGWRWAWRRSGWWRRASPRPRTSTPP
ncbi:3-hydroxyacyl-CoA dehydrogenase family protein [Blastococcus brunescens]|uniref:3-hydroxyacyl-CoA dehydrogenase NAD-binding domain-containing protein n=1 Tax=Blastococcus brunescens TaxID=1564165 RepID=A0ABZ1B4A1_9ACTN|nr:3-hydroxyacyl-CoA dehydrogenase NAD-binding domain-containing protein [Blastococcus sp. BMG 8361]WRL64189.1 3-hydroxyacyl-CoA dehydrogenase NAD-binding domain-containing protein [Blastococcus sp. BMG 8361]